MDWELTSTKINEVIAKSDISMQGQSPQRWGQTLSFCYGRPQPFLVDAVTVCGVKFPQTEVSDRFFVDKTSFFVNVKQGVSASSLLDAFINFFYRTACMSHCKCIPTISPVQKSLGKVCYLNYLETRFGLPNAGQIGDTIDVCISLRTAPTLSDEPMKIGDNTMLVLSTKILQSDRTRFEDAIQHRSLVRLQFLQFFIE